MYSSSGTASCARIVSLRRVKEGGMEKMDAAMGDDDDDGGGAAAAVVVAAAVLVGSCGGKVDWLVVLEEGGGGLGGASWCLGGIVDPNMSASSRTKDVQQ